MKRTSKKLAILMCISTLFVFACNQNNSDKDNSKDSTVVEDTYTENTKLKFEVTNVNSDDNPTSELYITYKAKKEKLITVNGTLVQSKRDELMMPIPENAENIYSTFWAGLLTEIYSVKEPEKTLIYMLQMDEGESSPDVKVLKEYLN